jgi:hypothetical protein
MGMHDDWKAAKKTSEDNFKQAYENWIAKAAPAAKSGDPKAKKIMLDDALKNAGLDKGPKYTSYLKFDEGFGKELDKFEAIADQMTENLQKVDTLTMSDVLKSKKLSALFQHYCTQVAKVLENYDYVTSGYKMKPQEIYNTFIKPGSPKALNIDSSEVEKWQACEQSGNWKPADQLRKDLLPTIATYLNARFPAFLKHKVYRKFLAADMGKGKGVSAMEKQIEAVRAIATDYARQVQAYGKRWKDLKPDFWTPLNTALNDILAKVDTLAKA